MRIENNSDLQTTAQEEESQTPTMGLFGDGDSLLYDLTYFLSFELWAKGSLFCLQTSANAGDHPKTTSLSPEFSSLPSPLTPPRSKSSVRSLLAVE